jgi:hypothetical protein
MLRGLLRGLLHLLLDTPVRVVRLGRQPLLLRLLLLQWLCRVLHGLRS